MLALLEKAAGILLSLGLPGVIILGQAWWIWKLHGQVAAVQEKRVQDAYRLAEAASSAAQVLERNTEVLNALIQS